jgi:regulator of protease activity HflC (stomatin/prohibitin superfamily)
MGGLGIFGLVVLLLVICVVVTNIVIVPQANAFVIQRFGKYSRTLDAGFHVKTPFIEKVAKRVSLKEQVADFPPQPVITRDNVTMQIDTVVFFQVMDAKLYTYGVTNPIAAIESLSATTLRNIIGDLELDHTLTSRDTINTKITAILDEATDKWGIKVNRVEVKNIIPPREIQDAMEKQMKAEREKRAMILKAEGEKQAAITAAEGQKQSAILRGEAVKQQRILEAEGEAQAILAVQRANADAIKLLNESNPGDKVLALRSLEALAKVANGQATKLIIPSNLQDLSGTVASIKELLTDPAKPAVKP